MQYAEARSQFIELWSAQSYSWGISKSTAIIHALFLISDNDLSTDDIMQELNLSRGNVSMTLKELMEWELIHRVYKTNTRKDYYTAEKDVWLIGQRILHIKRTKEIEPVLVALKELRKIKDNSADPNKIRSFQNIIEQLYGIVKTSNRILNSVQKAKKIKVFKWIKRL